MHGLIPVISTLSNLTHICLRSCYKGDTCSAYGRYLQLNDYTDHYLRLIPGINILTTHVTNWDRKELGLLSFSDTHNEEKIAAAVAIRPSAIFYAPEALRTNREFLLRLIENKADVMAYTGLYLNDADFILEAVSRNGFAIGSVRETDRGNRQIQEAAVTQNGLCLACLYPYNAERELVLKAVSQNGLALQYADEVLKYDVALVRTAVRQNGLALEFAAGSLKNDLDTALLAVQQNGLALAFVSKELKDNDPLLLAACTQNGLAIEFFSNEAEKNKKYILAAVNQNGLALEHATDEFQNDQEVALAAVTQNGLALAFAGAYLRANPVILRAATTQNVNAYTYVTQHQVLRIEEENPQATVPLAVAVPPPEYKTSAENLRLLSTMEEAAED